VEPVTDARCSTGSVNLIVITWTSETLYCTIIRGTIIMGFSEGKLKTKVPDLTL